MTSISRSSGNSFFRFPRSIGLSLVIAGLMAFGAGCGSDDTVSVEGTTTTDPSIASTTTSTGETTTSSTSEPTSSTLAGEPIDGFPKQGDTLAVLGVVHDDVLNVRAEPGTDQSVVAEVDPTADDLVASGRAQSLSNSIWYEVTADGTTGWASSSFLGFIGSVDDVTSAYLGGDPLPETETMVDMADLVAAAYTSDDPPSKIVQSVAPSVGDLGEITYDVVGLGDDSIAGVRLHIFATPSESGEGFILKSIELTTFCSRGVSDEVCV